MIKKVSVLGSTGSIGRQALDVIAASPEQFSLFAIAAGSNVDALLSQARAFHPQYVACAAPFDASLLPPGTKAIAGDDAVCALAGSAEPDVVVMGISGVAALPPLLHALRAGRRVALANKESIVCGKPLVDAACKSGGGEVLPVDSEQSAIFQCLSGGAHSEVARLLLTASGGPFWRESREALAAVTVEDALRHPTWRMGAKVTIDSATLFNKGLEVIEASYLFDIPGPQITVLIHPQSIVHSLVEFADGTVIANLSQPDMRIPIQYAMTYPQRRPSPSARLSLADAPDLQFFKASPERYPALRLAYAALDAGGTMTTVFNGANEAAVQLFVEGRIGFLDIERAVERAMNAHAAVPVRTLDTVRAADAEARRNATALFTR